MRTVTTARRGVSGLSFVRAFSHLRPGNPPKRRKKRKEEKEEKEEQASREWRMNYSTGSSRLPRR